jgi:hypothetical protein
MGGTVGTSNFDFEPEEVTTDLRRLLLPRWKKVNILTPGDPFAAK